MLNVLHSSWHAYSTPSTDRKLCQRGATKSCPKGWLQETSVTLLPVLAKVGSGGAGRAAQASVPHPGCLG